MLGEEGRHKPIKAAAEEIRRAKAASDPLYGNGRMSGGSEGGRRDGQGTANEGNGGRVQSEERRRLREAQLAQLTPEDRAAELESHRNSPWHERRLRAHAEKHSEDFIKVGGYAPTADQLRELSSSIMNQPNVVLTELDKAGEIEYHFIRFIQGSECAIIVTSRAGFTRTAYPAVVYEDWLSRHSAAIEVQ